MYTLYKQSLAAAMAAALLFACGSGDKKQAQSPSSSTQTTAATYGDSDQSAQGGSQRKTQPQRPQDQPKQPTTPPSGGPQDTTSQADTSSSEPTSTTTTTQATMDTSKVTTLSDGEIVAVEEAMDDRAVKLGELAQKKAQDAQVKKFAGAAVTGHRDDMNKLKTLAKQQKITPKDNATSNKLKSDASNAEKDLKNRKAHDFDSAYMDSQVRMHTEALGIIDNQLLPSAKNDALKSHINSERGMVADHLSKAKDIQTHLGAVGTTTVTSGTTDHRAGSKAKTGTPKGGTPTDHRDHTKSDKKNK
ncbi:MAG: hypothetical protein JWP87_2998 [Labilithrix sp.]|nr:hypothetical protein [Labilithrix sp.]